jgi:putative effector of murein hydrolase LrgA (UPF0299 family)
MKTNLLHLFGMILIVAVIVLCGNSIIYVKAHPEGSYVESVVKALPGMAILVAFTLAGFLCKRYIPLRLPAAAYIATIGCILTIPGTPGSTGAVSEFMNALSGTIIKYTNEINFMSLTTPILAYAGLSLAKDMDALKESGWKLVVVAVFVFIGTFLGSALIADIVLRATGQI